MTVLAVTRCVRPVITAREMSTYTVLGFAGYGLAAIVAAALFVAWDVPLVDRLIASFAPPLAFLVVVAIARAIVGFERIVFYQTAAAGVLLASMVDAVVGGHAARVVDVVTIAIGTFLVLGRLGCFAVACCHGRPARLGVVYGAEHVRVGFWARWSGRRLWPTQLVESGGSLSLVIAGLIAGWARPGVAAVVYIVGYGLARFALELVRGDSLRLQALGISEAQWTAPLTILGCALWRPGAITIGAAVSVVAGTAVLVALRRRRELFAPPHLRELDLACAEAARSGEGVETSLGVSVSRHALPDGRVDWVLASAHPRWSTASARRLADLMWPSYELVEGRLGGFVHVVEPR
jgi:hypothetical protein